MANKKRRNAGQLQDAGQSVRRTLEEYPDVLDVEDLMEFLRIGRNVAYKLLQSGAIGSIHIGRMWRIPKHCVREYLAGTVTDAQATKEESKIA